MDTALGENILKRVLPDAAEAMQHAIAEAGGREVFFAGELDARGRIVSARVCARGNAGAVPALFEGLGVRDVVLHNHPSGILEPSNADLELASMYSAHGHGVYIIDNEATRVYVVVEPFTGKDAERLDPLDLAKVLGPGSELARRLPHFEVRLQQARMMETAAEAFNHERISVIEAPTGVGKTMAYLLPAVLWAVRNKERVVVSTRTINLQEQIVFKDIPLLQRCLDEKFRACLVKGRRNYVCLRKLQRAHSEAELFDSEDTREQIEAIMAWVEKTEDGSRSDLPFMPANDVWEKVCSEPDACGMGRCPDQKKCFVTKARREIANADILVVNHHIFFSDIAIKVESENFHTAQAVLPAYQRVIFDEAHSIEESATEYFGASAARYGALAGLGRLHRFERQRERGLLPLIKARLIKDCPQLALSEFEEIQQLIDEKIVPVLSVCRDRVNTLFDILRETAMRESGQIGRDIKWRLTQEILDSELLRRLHLEEVTPTVDEFRTLTKRLSSLHMRLRDIPAKEGDDEPPLYAEALQLRAYTNRLDNTANALSECTSEELAENTVRWIEAESWNEGKVRVARCPLEVGKPLAEWVYENLKTVIMTSATLTIRQEFDYLYHRVGLDHAEEDRVETVFLDSPFDFREQALLCIATDLPEPSARDFGEASINAIGEAIRVTRGHAFVLFTSFSALNQAAKALERDLRAQGITLLRQGAGSRTKLLDQFRSDTASVLFGTDSFWEGVDVAGESLQCVIIPKLPFRVPTEPIQQARAEAIESQGGNAFMGYSVPQAVIKFRQGFGRLIRRRTDRGAIVVLDKRILTKYYGRVFIQSLPEVGIAKGSTPEVMQQLAAFFNRSKPVDD